MFDPSKWFGRAPYQQVGDTDDPIIEVDQISFTSSCSSGEHEGYVTARDTTKNRVNGDSVNDLISFEEDLNLPGEKFKFKFKKKNRKNNSKIPRNFRRKFTALPRQPIIVDTELPTTIRIPKSQRKRDRSKFNILVYGVRSGRGEVSTADFE